MRYLLIPLYLLLVSCGALSDRNAIARQIEAGFAECGRRAQEGELRTKVAEAQCQKDSSLRILEKNDSNDMDLMRLTVDKNIELAKRLDAGTVTKEHAQQEFDEFWSRIDAEMNRRDSLYGTGSHHPPKGNRPFENCRQIKGDLECNAL